MTRAELQRLWARGQRGWPEDSPVAQFPNPPLLAALAGGAVAAVTSGSAQAAGRAVLYVGLGVWAYLELTAGANRLRRAIGAAGLAFVVVRITSAFDG